MDRVKIELNNGKTINLELFAGARPKALIISSISCVRGFTTGFASTV